MWGGENPRMLEEMARSEHQCAPIHPRVYPLGSEYRATVATEQHHVEESHFVHARTHGHLTHLERSRDDAPVQSGLHNRRKDGRI